MMPEGAARDGQMVSNLIAQLRKFARGKRHFFGTMKRDPLASEQRIIAEAFEALSRPQSAIVFTTHKCASTFIDKTFSKFEAHSEYVVRRYARALGKMNSRLDVGSANEVFYARAYDRLFKARGEIYVPHRKPVDFPGRAEFRHVFFLRDPRDVLVSAYYSFGFSHPLPGGVRVKHEFLEERKRIQDQGIDRYAIEASTHWLLPVYEEYRRFRETAAASIYLKYDDFKDDTEGFLWAVADFLEIELPQKTVQELAESASPVQAQVNVSRHKRSGRSGQYLHELSSDTVEFLNTTFADILEYWEFKDPN